MKKIILIDGNSIMYRAFYATFYAPSVMKTKDGLYTNAIYSFINMVNKIIDDYEYAFVSFDAAKKTFRHNVYQEYKANRKSAPNELYEQIPAIKNYLDIINVKRKEEFEFEGDDLIASISSKFYNEFDKIDIITGDKDLLQLVDPKITVYLTKKGITDLEEYNMFNFYEKLELKPLQIIDYKALVGDKSDNLIGVKGIGEKTALKLLNEYENLDSIYSNLDKLTSKISQAFISDKETAYKTRMLATLIRDVPLDIEFDDLKIKSYNYNNIVDFYAKYEFNSLLKKLNKVNVETGFEIVLETDLTKIKDIVSIAVTSKPNYKDTIIEGIGLYSQGKYYFIEYQDIYLIKDILEDENIKKYTYDYKMINYYMYLKNIEIKNVCYDLLLDSYLINPSYPNDDFKITVEHFMDTDIEYSNSIKNIKLYNALKAKYIYESFSVVRSKIKENAQEELSDVELKLSKTLSIVEHNGVYIDTYKLAKIGEELDSKISVIEKEIYELTGFVFNINSPKQLGDILFEKLNIPYGKKNKTGYSTSVEVLEKIDHPVISKILEYRTYAKLITTYVKGLNDVITKNFIYPLYKQAFTNTGRLSSINPNIQNMPVRTEEGQVIRKIFKSRFDSGLIISADYSQIELRVLAHLSEDDFLLDCFNNNLDIHNQTAALINDIEINSVSQDQRRVAKAINFGIIYGMSAWGLSEQLKISPMEANLFIERYFDKFRKAKNCLDNFIKSAKEKGYSKTVLNRIRYIQELSNNNKALVGFGERTAMNSPIQGSAADIIKIAMNKVSEKLKGFRTLIIAQVHDELLFDCPKEELEEVIKIIKKEMEGAYKLKVKLEVNISYGENWFMCK